MSFTPPWLTGTDAQLATRFLKTLQIPEGPKAGQPLTLVPFQEQFVNGVLAAEINVACLSIGRGNAKTALSAGIARGSLMGVWDKQPRRDILLAARSRDQAAIAWNFVAGFAQSLPEEERAQLQFRCAPRLEIEYKGEGGPHILRAISADGKTALGSVPTLVLMDERGHWPLDKGDDLEHALLSGLGKRGGKGLLISTSASTDTHTFSQWLDNPQPGVYIQEHRPPPSLHVDDLPSLEVANPGADHGIGSSLEWLQGQARRANARGGSTLTSFRLYNRNERVSGEARDVLLTADEWLNCEAADLPPRSGECIVGIDLGGSASMSAAAYYWPATGRLEALVTFPCNPGLADRGAANGVSGRYIEMENRGELNTMGDKTVPVALWLKEIMGQVEGENVSALTADRYKQSELAEALDRAGVRFPVVWRGQGFRDGGEDCERFRRAAYDGKVKSRPSLLLRSAFADAVVLRDPANNLKLAKARSTGRIDAVAATVLAVAEGARCMGRPSRNASAATWA
ncbi:MULTISPECIES: terminase TerL endonuclease subunit [unclassified Paracoccus (in: a-proteobacteria)]|uniref:terminase TerL endonuclease subunit n=1 Tax=unclassified Paracoccus (in: a-proteobacteria) TaxID=2688777 RepID=UPI0016035033|nr:MULTISPECIES: terminase TerL endonuclease subunit [unclassified Paracoccus (in: a-proteobacteria)]MBB1492960.1 terminase [Paracoccus sp. MC1854]MBB1499529.1 terminase [Paracoccus sp. MC1862]QQO45758.1 terminase [Paracoccus sp. MC1862]